jgi:signal transduction histidine kinase/response regulator RpfG family c-di-GMP phosphodiesterase
LLWVGIDKAFTGEAGAISYLVVVSLAAFVYCARTSQSRSHAGAGRICAGFALLLASRVLHISPIMSEYQFAVLPVQVLAAAGLYFVFRTTYFAGERSLRDDRLLLWGGLAGVAFGVVAFLLFADTVSVGTAMPLLALFVTFAPLGILAGSTMRRWKQGKGGDVLQLFAGIMFVGATIITGFIGLAFVPADNFWGQLYALGDLFGVILLVAASVVFQGGEQSDEVRIRIAKRSTSPQERAAWEASPMDRLNTIDAAVNSENNIQDVLQTMSEMLADQIGAELVITRIAKAGDELFEVAAHYSLGETDCRQSSRLSIALTDIEKLRRVGLKHEAGFIVEWGDCVENDGELIPKEIDWRGSKAMVVPVYERAVLLAFMVIGFFQEEPPPEAVPFLKYHMNKVLTLIKMMRTRERMLDRERALALCKEELESVNQLKSNFMSIVSHELRTPLTSIKAYTETLLDNMGSIQLKTVQEFLNVMNEENERLIKLVDNILNYSRMETGNLKVEKISCNLNTLIEEIHASLRTKVLAAEVNMDVRLPKRAVVVDADRELIRQLLQNLANNAVKFTPKSGRVTISLEEEASAARIVVQDTGKGIPEDQLERIFERFHQVDASDTREHGGSGLGLAICKNITEWHDGKIWVENVKDSGAKFVVMLPMKDIFIRHAPAVGVIGSRRFEREKYLTLLVELIAEFLQAKKSSIMILDQDQQILRVVAAKGLDPEFVQNTRVEVGDRIAGQVALTGQALHVFDIEEEADYGRANNSAFYGTHSFISVPLKRGGETLGVLNVSDHVEGREFTRADRELLESLGTIIVNMLRKLDAYEAVSSNFERLKDAMRSILDIREVWGSKNLWGLTLIALKVGELLDLDEDSLTSLRLGMNMYDLGLMKIPRNLRSKKEQLSREELARLRSHANIGYALVSPMGLEERIMKMIRSHHENYDGSGYPDGLVGTEIPIEARIVGVVDAFRALISEGPYRRTYSINEARKEIIKNAGAKFDPRVVGALVKALRELGVKEYKGELILEVVERELEEERRMRREREILAKEMVKEGTP